MNIYHEGNVVELIQDHTALGLKSGDEGVVWAIYDLPIPAYEVTFRGEDGQEFDLTLGEQEITTAKANLAPVI